MKKRQVLNLILLGIGVVLFYLFISRVGFKKIAQTLSGANLFFCLLGVFIYLGVIAIRARKWLVWSRILKRDASYKEILPFYLINSLMGNITPLKSGEAVTPFFLKKFLKTSVGRGFSLVLLDRFSELFVFVLFLIWAICYLILRGLPGSFMSALLISIFAVLFLLLVLLSVVVFLKTLTLKIIQRIALVGFFKKPFEILGKEILNLYEGIDLAKKEKIFIKIILLTVLGWFLEFGAYYAVFLSVVRLHFFDVISAQIVSSAASLVAFVPAGIGVGDISSASLLNWMGYPLIQTMGAILLVRVFLTGTLLFVGAIGFYLVKRKQSEF